MKIIKRSGEEVVFDREKIVTAITKANLQVEERDRLNDNQINSIVDDIEIQCHKEGHALNVEDIQDLVETGIMENGAYKVAKLYITYRFRRQIMRKQNTTDDQIMSLLEESNEEVKQAFIDGKYAFYQNGSWNCGDIATKSKFAVSACMFPVVDAEHASLYEMVGGPNDTLAVTATCVDPAVCAKAAFDLGCTISREGNLNGAGLPTWAVDYDTSACNALSNQVAEMVGQSKGMVLFGDNFPSADAANTYLDYIAQLFAGDIDAEGFAKGLAADLQ